MFLKYLFHIILPHILEKTVWILKKKQVKMKSCLIKFFLNAIPLPIINRILILKIIFIASILFVKEQSVYIIWYIRLTETKQMIICKGWVYSWRQD